MKKCLIFSAAEFSGLLCPPDPGDLVIAADGGLRHLQAIGLEPDVILGDFDSLGYVPQNGRVYPVEKDDTDTMLAIRLGLERGCREFWIYGGMDGERLDHTVANYQALGYLARQGAWGYLIGTRQIATCLSGQALVFPPEAGGILSVFCLGADASGVSLSGVQYPLAEASLTAHFPLGVSNHFLGRPARIQVRSGTLLCMWDRKNGVCSRAPL